MYYKKTVSCAHGMKRSFLLGEQKQGGIKMADDQNLNLDNQDDIDNQNQDDQGGDQDGDEGVKFSKAQMQQISSVMGRIVKNQIEKEVIPIITSSSQRTVAPQVDTKDVLGKLDQELSDDIFGGKPFSAISKVIELSHNVKTNLTKNKQQEVDRIITSYSEKPYYKDTFQDIKDVAYDAVQNKGYPVPEAVEYAYQLARAEHLEKRLNPDSGDEDNLNLLKGGRNVKRQGKPKLPPNFQKAFERDKAKGLVKDEAEWISYLSPQVREQQGL